MFSRLIVVLTAAVFAQAQTSPPTNTDPPWLLFIGLVFAFVAGGAVVWLAFRATRNSGETLAETLRESLAQVEEKLHQFEVARESSHATLREQLRQLAASELELQKETARLSGALRSPGVRGRWGEMQLRRVVELAGMSEHCDFEVQTADKNGMRPDMIVKLPNGRTVIVDAKAPLQAYIEATEALDETARSAKLREHAAQVRAHVVRLSAKSYWDSIGHTPEFVVMFLPGESFFSAALQQEPELLDYSSDRKVILATPSTLIALLKTVAYGWRQEKAERRAEEIRDIGTQLYERLRAMASDLSVLGSHIERTAQAYNRVLGTWDTKTLPSARRLHELGAGSGEPIEPIRRAESPVRIVNGAE